MGEFHHSRYPENEWRCELLEMMTGGMDIVATHVFWIHHEEIEDRREWSGNKNLRKFIETAAASQRVVGDIKDCPRAWAQGVLDNHVTVATKLTAPAAGRHTLHACGVDAGVVIQKFVIRQP